jgi:hypothetical protein
LYCTMVADKRGVTSRTPLARAELDGRMSMEMKTMARRIRKLEVGAGIVETEESRREREQVEILHRRLAAGLVRVGEPARKLTDSERRELAGLKRGRDPSSRVFESKRTLRVEGGVVTAQRSTLRLHGSSAAQLCVLAASLAGILIRDLASRSCIKILHVDSDVVS